MLLTIDTTRPSNIATEIGDRIVRKPTPKKTIYSGTTIDRIAIGAGQEINSIGIKDKATAVAANFFIYLYLILFDLTSNWNVNIRNTVRKEFINTTNDFVSNVHVKPTYKGFKHLIQGGTNKYIDQRNQ